MSTDDSEIEPVPIALFLPPADWEVGRDITVPLRGRYVVTTESLSRYEIDCDLGLVTRLRGTTDSDDPEVLPAAHLRRDGEALKLLRVIVLRCGVPMVVDVETLGDPSVVAFTRRTTTYIQSISFVRENEADN
ncbi:hypothetical protein [Microbacterium panaciterrae]|uniref:UTRA domain-containing protein n=1 Tax=Microbacterium panaciterrae TaxID=985759 RepID=A0ABP8P6R5_9MICO